MGSEKDRLKVGGSSEMMLRSTWRWDEERT